MAQYIWTDLSFKIPSGMSDQTVVTLMDDEDNPSFNLTVTQEPVPPNFSLHAYVADQVTTLGEELTGYAFVAKTERKVGSFDAQVVEQTAEGDDGAKLYQHQAYIHAKDRVIVASATASKEGKPAAASALNALLDSLKVG